MTRYLLDTSPFSAYLNGRPAALARLEPWIGGGEATTSVLVYAEVLEAIRSRSNFDRRYRQLHALLESVHPFPLTFPILDRYSLIRRQLRPPYGPGLIGDIDTLIAATAIEQGLTVVTCDGDFARVPDLPVILIPRDELRR